MFKNHYNITVKPKTKQTKLWVLIEEREPDRVLRGTDRETDLSRNHRTEVTAKVDADTVHIAATQMVTRRVTILRGPWMITENIRMVITDPGIHTKRFQKRTSLWRRGGRNGRYLV